MPWKKTLSPAGVLHRLRTGDRWTEAEMSGSKTRTQNSVGSRRKRGRCGKKKEGWEQERERLREGKAQASTFLQAQFLR